MAEFEKTPEFEETAEVEFHTHTHVNRNAEIVSDDNKNNSFKVHHIIKVTNGSLESALHLIGYSFTQIREFNHWLTIRDDVGQNQIFSCTANKIPLSIKKERPPGAHIVEYDNKLYGVVVIDGEALICGCIKRVMKPQDTHENNLHSEKGVFINKTSDGLNWSVMNRSQVGKSITQGKHIISVAESGSLLIIPNAVSGHGSKHQPDAGLLLVLGKCFFYFLKYNYISHAFIHMHSFTCINEKLSFKVYCDIIL